MVGSDTQEQKAGAMTQTPVKEMSFEQAMAELEQVLGQLERGDVALDESIALYERGAALKARCEAKLKEAEEKVAAITLDADGTPIGATPVDGL
jgi:exodeoxyribonuclease VII small subunit